MDDIEDSWTFPEDKFDLINIRTMVGSIHDWKKLFEQSYKHLTPGGYVEFADFDISNQYSDDGTLDLNGPTSLYYKYLGQALKIAGTAVLPATFEKILKDIGFEDVTVNKAKAPTKPWTKDARLKELGNCMLELSAGYESYGLAAFTRILKLDEDKARRVIDNAVKEHHDLSVHAYMHT